MWQAQWGQKDSYVTFKYLSLCNFKSNCSSNLIRKVGNYVMLLHNDFGPIVSGDLASSFLGSPWNSYTNYNLWTFFSRSLHTNSLRSYTKYVVNNFKKYQTYSVNCQWCLESIHTIIKWMSRSTPFIGMDRLNKMVWIDSIL